MGPADLRRRPDRQHQSVWHDLLLARRSTRVSRDRRPDRPVDHPHVRAPGIRATGAREAHRRLRDVLALCGCDMGSGSSSGVRDRTITGAEAGATTPQRPAVEEPEGAVVVLPAPTAWPFVLALGVALIFAGLLTGPAVSALGALLYVAGGVGWFREVFPHERQELVAVAPAARPEIVPARGVTRLRVASQVPRAWLPLKVHPVSAGVKGGLAGAVAMALLAMLYGLVTHGSIWYPINLLAGSLYAQSAMPTLDELLHFHLGWFLFASALHLSTSLLVGFLYGAMLPMVPRQPILLGGVTTPLIWTGLLHEVIAFVNPLMDERINWWWFAASQVAFGVVAGLVVVRQAPIWTRENAPLAMRAGIEAPGILPERHNEDDRR